MYSDKWIESECTEHGPIKIIDDGSITYSLWKDTKHNYIGAGLDFEYADDYHYEFLISEWQKLMNCLPCISNRDSQDKLLKAYFKDYNFLAFENLLSENNIKFEKIAFY